MSTLEFTVFLVFSFLSSLITFLLAVHMFLLKSSKRTTLFAFLMLAVSQWSFAVGGGMLSPNQAIAFDWFVFRMIGVLSVPTLWLAFAVQYTHKGNRLKTIHKILLGGMPVASFIFLLLPDTKLFLADIEYTSVNGYFIINDLHIGPLFWAHLTYSFLLILAGDFLIFRQAAYWMKIYRTQAIALIAGTSFPLFTQIAISFNLFPQIHGNFDVIGFTLTGILFTWVLFNNKFLDITPVAHQTLFDHIPDALFLFNDNHRLMEMNPAANQLMKANDVVLVKSPQPEEFFDPPIHLSDAESSFPYQMEIDGSTHFFDGHNLPLQQQGESIGHLVILRDITQQHQLTEKLRLLATTDTLTGVANRRHFVDQSLQHLHHALRYGGDLSLLMLDIDYFKQINDQYGHAVGDQILIQLTEILRQNIRTVDILSRYGGEEFCILLPETPQEAAQLLAERLRWLVKESSFPIESLRLRIRVSIGAASLNGEPITIDTLINRADRAMYESKMNGRDRITVWNPAIPANQGSHYTTTQPPTDQAMDE